MKSKEIKVGSNKQNLNIFELQDQFLMDDTNHNTEAIADAINQLNEQDSSVKQSAVNAEASAKAAVTAANLAKSAAQNAKNEVSQYENFRKISSSGITATNQTNVDIFYSRNKVPLYAFSASGSAFRTDNGDILVSAGSKAVVSGVVKVSGAKYGDKIGAYIWINETEMYYFYGIVPVSSISSELETETKKLGTALDKKIITADKKKVLGEDTALTKTDVNIAKNVKLTVNAGDLYLHIPPLVFDIWAGARISLKVGNFGGSRGRVEQGFTTFLTVTGLS